MRTLLIGFILTVIGGGASLAQTNFYTNVTNLWYQGGVSKTNVLTIANARLAANSNDIAGLILKAEYHFAFLEVEAISNAYLRVIQIGDTITTTNFVKQYQRFSRHAYLDLLDIFAEEPVTLQEIQEGKQKALINHKPFSSAEEIEALQKDGYFD
jgi:hypothetical protein